MAGWVPLLSFMEQAPLYDQIKAGSGFRPYGPAPWIVTFAPWSTQVPGLLCPSDPKSSGKLQGTPTLGNFDYCGRSNYCFSMGDTVSDNVYRTASCRGIFWRRSGTRLRDITDGTSNTIAVSEKSCGEETGWRKIKGGAVYNISGLDAASGPQTCLNTRGSNGEYASAYHGQITGRPGRRWAAGEPVYAGFTTVLPPNAPSCINGTDHLLGYGIYSPSSYHPGGVNGLMADGSCRFFSETIDTGNLSAANVTSGQALRCLGPLGSKDGGEPKSDL